MAGAFDATMKQLLDACAPDWVTWLAPLVGLPATVAVESLDAELSTVQPVADKVFRLQPPAEGLLHIEAQSSWDGGFSDRMLLYNVLLHERYGGPVHTIALLLRRDAAGGVTGTVSRAGTDGREYLRFGYTAVRVWELPADQLLAGGLGTTPLALLTDDAAARMTAVAKRFTERAISESPTTADASLLLSCGYILTGLRYDKALAKSLFDGVQQMKESSTYQAIRSEGRDEGIALGVQRSLLKLLQKRFGTISPEVENRVRAVTDAARLDAALDQVVDIASPDELTL